MRCAQRNCKNVRDVDPVRKLCPPCDAWLKDHMKRIQNESPTPADPEPIPDLPATDISTPNLVTTARVPTAPPLDIKSIQNTYNKLKTSSTESPVMLDMLALVLNIYSKLSETDTFQCEIKKAHSRLDALEAKVGDDKEVAERLGLAVRHLPLPPPGYTDLDMAKQVLAEIKAPGINLDRDVVKAIRKIPSKPTNPSQPILGTVLVEMKNEESRAGIMKNKHSLQHHPDNAIRRVVIKNMKSRDQMLIEKIGNNILKRIPGCENHFLGGTGQIRESLEQKNNHPSPHNPEVRPSHSRSQHLPPQTGPRSTHSSHDFRPCSSNASTIPQYPQQCQRTSYNSGPPVPARLPPQGPNQHQAGHQHQQSASTLGQQSFE